MSMHHVSDCCFNPSTYTNIQLPITVCCRFSGAYHSRLRVRGGVHLDRRPEHHGANAERQITVHTHMHTYSQFGIIS